VSGDGPHYLGKGITQKTNFASIILIIVISLYSSKEVHTHTHTHAHAHTHTHTRLVVRDEQPVMNGGGPHHLMKTKGK